MSGESRRQREFWSDSLFAGRLARIVLFAVVAALSSVEKPATLCAPPNQYARGAKEGLSVDRTVSGTLSGGESVVYSFTLAAGRLARFKSSQAGNGLIVRILAPSGKVISELPCLEGGAQTFSYRASVSGVHKLEVHCNLESKYSAGYSITWVEDRSARAEDRDLTQAEGAFVLAEKLRTQGREGESRQATENYAKAVKLFAALGEKTSEMATLVRMGGLYLLQGQLARATDCFSRVLSVSDRSADPRYKVDALNGIAALRILTGDRDSAMEYCNRALDLARGSGDRWGMARALQNLGDYFGWSSNYEQSSDHYRQALGIRRELADYRGQAQTLVTLGYNATELEDLQAAAEYYERARTLFSALNDRRGLARVAAAMIQLYCKTARYWEALDLYGAARDQFMSLDELEVTANMHNSMGYVYYQVGLPDRALEHYLQALALSKSDSVQAITHCLIGMTLVAHGDIRAATDHHRQAVDLFRKVKDKRLEAISLCHLADAYLADGQSSAALGIYDSAREIFTTQRDLQGEAIALGSLGRLHEMNGDREQALRFYKDALSLNRQVRDRYHEYQTLHNIARVERDLGHWQEARAWIEAALALVESLRTSVPGPELRSSFFATAQQSHEIYVDILMQTQEDQPSGDLIARALHASEGARARSLLELLAEAGGSLRKGVDPELLGREQQLRRSISVKADRRTQLLSGRDNEAQILAVDKEIRALDATYEDLQALIKIRSPLYASLTQPQPLTVEQIREQVLDGETLLLEYALGEKHSYLWAVGKSNLKSYVLPSRSTIEAIVGQVRDLLIARQKEVVGETAKQKDARVRKADIAYWTEAERLSKLLLSPAASEIATRRLIIVPDGMLQYLSFGALPSPAPGGTSEERAGRAPRPLIADHEIVILPSASTLQVLRRQAAGRKPGTKSVAVFADPMFEAPVGRRPIQRTPGRIPADSPTADGGPRDGTRLARLLSTRQEAEAIMAVVPADTALLATGFSATRDRAMSPELKDYRIVHFATHGFADDTNPKMSWIAFSTVNEAGKPRSGFLRLFDIYNLNLSADLVVLSACSTALGKNIRGEGLVGLVRGFMYAGTARVVASLWRVDDQSTAELMKRFYQGMLKENLSPAAALRAAQVAMSRHERWSAPYYWAGFVLQGEYR